MHCIRLEDYNVKNIGVFVVVVVVVALMLAESVTRLTLS